MFQKTLKSKIIFKGIGLHSGVISEITISPAAPNTGILFVRVDTNVKNKKILANFESVTPAKLCTRISNGSISVSTIEHLMAALHGTGIDNVLIEINGEEIPILDGSAKEFTKEINRVGLINQSSKVNFLKITNKIICEDNNKFTSIEPIAGDYLEIDCQIDFHDHFIKKQSKRISFQNNEFMDIYDSRTFCLKRDLENIFKMGLGKGGSLENAVIVSDDRVLNQDGLRYNDEFVRHKILDCLGDLYLSGYKIIGKVKSHQGGHELTYKLVKNLMKNKNNWKLIQFEDQIFSKKIKNLSSQAVVNI
jgi:UDP-3-O-[3-hydroxymyristoyl] N-acetylglucosamine deacetylase